MGRVWSPWLPLAPQRSTYGLPPRPVHHYRVATADGVQAVSWSLPHARLLRGQSHTLSSDLSSGTLANFILLVASDQVGIPQSFAWTLLNPYIVSCPANNTPIAWQAFPSLTVVNGPSGIDLGFQQLPYPDGGSALTHNRTALSYPGREVELEWTAPGQVTGPYNQTTFVGAQVDTNASSPVSMSLSSFTRASTRASKN